MGYRGRVRQGAIVFEGPTSLSEGAVVEVVVVSEGPGGGPAIPTLAERFAPVVGIVEGLAPDLASSHHLEFHGGVRPGDE